MYFVDGEALEPRTSASLSMASGVRWIAKVLENIKGKTSHPTRASELDQSGVKSCSSDGSFGTTDYKGFDEIQNFKKPSISTNTLRHSSLHKINFK